MTNDGVSSFRLAWFLDMIYRMIGGVGRRGGLVLVDLCLGLSSLWRMEDGNLKS
jgi:hypothetical protein